MTQDIYELEREFRSSWNAYNLQNYQHYLDRAAEVDRLELLVRLMSAELEYAFQPPDHRKHSRDEDDDGIRPSLNLLLAHYPEVAARNDFVTRLAVHEYALRCRYDSNPPKPESYLPLCKESQCHLYDLLLRIEAALPMVRDAGGMIDHGNPDDSTVKDQHQNATISLDRLPNNLGTFLLVDFISRGGMGVVYSAIDLRNSAPVAVKVMRRDDAWSIYRFIEEFSWLSQVNHPNLVKLYDACVEGDYRYFSMERVEGRTVSEWFERSIRKKDDPWTPLRKVLAQAASAIQFLHYSGALHCDIKCTNLMITPKRRAVLLDMGLAVREGSTETGLGTLQYAAPEVLREGRHSRASDWYSFGLLIYEVISGGFNLKTRSITKEDDPNATAVPFEIDENELRAQMGDADPSLIDLCCDLIQLLPEDRPEGDEVIARLGGSISPNLATSQFVGRQDIVQRLSAVHQTTLERGSSQLVVVQGESGIGKSTLLRRWLRDSNFDENFVLTLRCFSQDRTPLRLLNGIVQELVRILGPLEPSLWADTLEPHLDGICLSFPQVRQLVDKGIDFKSSYSSKKSFDKENQATRHLMHWLVKLNRLRPFVIVIDDAQWADKRSLNWLGELLCRKDLVCTLVASEELTSADQKPSQLLQEISFCGHPRKDDSTPPGTAILGTPNRTQALKSEILQLRALAYSESSLLLRTWSEQIGYEISQAVQRNIIERAHGNPFLLQELFRTFVHYAKRGSITEEDWLAKNPERSGLRSRISLLPAKVENLLHYLAIADQPLEFHQLRLASRIKMKEMQPAVTMLESQGWITRRNAEGGTTIEIAHDKFRRAILSSLPKDRLQRRHFHMAKMLASTSPPAWSRMGDHYWASQQYREAAACYLQAAKNAADVGAYQEALRFLALAKHPDASRNAEEARNVITLEANCLGGVGSTRKSASLYEQLKESAEDPRERIRFQCKAGEQWIRAGELDNGVSELGSVLESMRFTKLRRSFFTQLGLFLRIARGCLRRPSLISHPHDDRPLDTTYRALNRLGVPLTFLDNQFGPDLIVRMKRLTETTGSETDRAVAMMHYGLLIAINGGPALKQGLRWLDCGRALATQANSNTARAMLHFCWLLLNVQYGRLRSCTRRAAQVEYWMDREPRSMHWEKQFVRWCMTACYWLSMNFQAGRQFITEARALADERADSMSQMLMRSGLAFRFDLMANDTEEAQRSLDLLALKVTEANYQSPWFFNWLNRADLEIYLGRSEPALRVLERDWPRLAKAYLFRSQHFRFFALNPKMCALMLRLRSHPQHRESTLKDCLKTAKQLARLRTKPYALYGEAFLLVLRAYQGKTNPIENWRALIDKLEHLQHSGIATALLWHLEIYHPSQVEQGRARQKFLQAGCVVPEQVMNLFLPLLDRESA